MSHIYVPRNGRKYGKGKLGKILWYVLLLMDVKSAQLLFCCILANYRINTRTLAVLAALGVYCDGVAKHSVNGRPVTAHIYEYTTQISIDPGMYFK